MNKPVASPGTETHPFDQSYRRPLMGLLCFAGVITIATCIITNLMYGWIDGILQEFKTELSMAWFNVANIVWLIIKLPIFLLLCIMTKYCLFPKKQQPTGFLQVR